MIRFGSLLLVFFVGLTFVSIHRAVEADGYGKRGANSRVVFAILPGSDTVSVYRIQGGDWQMDPLFELSPEYRQAAQEEAKTWKDVSTMSDPSWFVKDTCGSKALVALRRYWKDDEVVLDAATQRQIWIPAPDGLPPRQPGEGTGRGGTIGFTGPDCQLLLGTLSGYGGYLFDLKRGFLRSRTPGPDFFFDENDEPWMRIEGGPLRENMIQAQIGTRVYELTVSETRLSQRQLDALGKLEIVPTGELIQNGDATWLRLTGPDVPEVYYDFKTRTVHSLAVATGR